MDFSNILESFAGALLALFSAWVIWVLKTAYERHRKQVLSLQKISANVALIEVELRDNKAFCEAWVSVLHKDPPSPYSFSVASTKLDASKILDVPDRILLNQLLNLHYKLKRLNQDLNNMYSEYKNTCSLFTKLEDGEKGYRLLQEYYLNLAPQLESMIGSIEVVHKTVLPILIRIWAVDNVRFHSLFGYLGLLYRDIFPLITKAKLDEIEKKLVAEIAEKTQ